MRGEDHRTYLMVKYAVMPVAVTMVSMKASTGHPWQALRSASAQSHGEWQRERVERHVHGRQGT
jgi:hypothetical protein